MPTPQEKRFVRLAVQTGALSRQQVRACLKFQSDKRRKGSSIPLWDCAVLRSLLRQETAERLRRAAGELPMERLGEFRLVRKIGKGGMGSVYLGIGPDGQRAGIKVLSDALSKQRTYLTRFMREGQASIKLQHPNIVGGVDIGEEGGYYFFAMEYVEGRTVAHMLLEGEPLAPERASPIVLQVAEALAYAHEHNLIHRDIKPDNIMVTPEGKAKLMDLGLAHQQDTDLTALTRTGTAMGTPYYMAPEQIRDAKRADQRSDIYSLGATWYRMVTGQYPFDGGSSLEVYQKHMSEPLKSPAAVRSAVPRPVSVTIERMMAKDPDRRIQTAEDVCETIRTQCLGDRNILRELHVDAEKPSGELWDVQIAVHGRREKRRLSLDQLRKRIRKGQVTRDTPARPAGRRVAYEPAGSYRRLAREFPQDYAVSVGQPEESEETTTRAELHDLMAHFDKEKRSYRRKKKLRKMVPALIKLAVLGALVLIAWRFWPEITDFLARLVGEAPEPG